MTLALNLGQHRLGISFVPSPMIKRNGGVNGEGIERAMVMCSPAHFDCDLDISRATALSIPFCFDH
jgi:hypothetical protein